MKIYYTSQGDTFDIIAKKHYGNEIYTRELLNTNLDYADIIIFPAEIPIKIPEIDTTSAFQNISPWRL